MDTPVPTRGALDRHDGGLPSGQAVLAPDELRLRNAGVERVHGLPGDSLNGVEEALRSCGAIEWVHVRHEKSAAFAARTASSSSAAAALVEIG